MRAGSPSRQQAPLYEPWTDAAPVRTPAPRLPPCCQDCQRFTPDPINPPAGMGLCPIGHGYHYPAERHWCADNTARKP